MSKKYCIKLGDKTLFSNENKITTIKSNYRYTDDNPYVGLGLSRETKAGKKYTGFKADVAEFNDLFMKDFHYNQLSVNKMGLGIDEVLNSSINFSRKNYCCFFPEKPYPDDVKLTGNSIKSKKMPTYIETFLDKGIRQLLKGEGKEFIEYYYEYLSKIYNYQIPLKDIATKGKIKKSINEYLADIKTLTKAGRPKSRQAWYELAIKENLHVDNGDTIYYINTGKAKSHSDVKKITHYYSINNDGERYEFTKDIDKGYKKYKSDNKNEKKLLDKTSWIETEYPGYTTEEEIVMNCVLVPRDIIESETDVFCDEENAIEYNVAKYIDMFNKRITPLLVCFSKDIRGNILVDNPDNRNYFTDGECKLSSGEPNKIGDQDTYEQLMTMEDKEIKFWMKYDLTPPFVEECGMGTWENIKNDYLRRKEEERQKGIDKIRDEYDKVISQLTDEEIDDFIDEGILPPQLNKIIDIDPVTGNFMSKDYPDIIIGYITDIIDLNDTNNNYKEIEDS